MTGNCCFLNILNQNPRYANKHLGGCFPGSMIDKIIALLEEGKDFLYRPSLSHTRLYRLHIMNGKNNITLTLTLYREIIDMIFCCHIVALSSDIDHNMFTRIVKR